MTDSDITSIGTAWQHCPWGFDLNWKWSHDETNATTVPLAIQARITQMASEGSKGRTWPAVEQQLDYHLYGPLPIQCCFTCLQPRLLSTAEPIPLVCLLAKRQTCITLLVCFITGVPQYHENIISDIACTIATGSYVIRVDRQGMLYIEIRTLIINSWAGSHYINYGHQQFTTYDW